MFSSLDPDRIQTTANSPWGLRALKQYLIFARTGILQQANESLDQPTNDFERSVGTVLKEKGYDVVPQVGVAGFFIDLGVKHPAKPGAFLLGVECDGASYHSGRSARDRDRLRQEILVNLGWKIHRVWSTDWFKSRDSEIKRLLRTIESLLESDPAYRQQQEKVRKAESLRQRLEELRDREILVAFPDSRPDEGLLRPSLLQEFLDKRPTTRDEWRSDLEKPGLNLCAKSAKLVFAGTIARYGAHHDSATTECRESSFITRKCRPVASENSLFTVTTISWRSKRSLKSAFNR